MESLCSIYSLPPNKKNHTYMHREINGAKTDVSLLLTSPHKTEDVSAALSNCQTVERRQRKTDRQEKRDQECSSGWMRNAMTSSRDENGDGV